MATNTNWQDETRRLTREFITNPPKVDIDAGGGEVGKTGYSANELARKKIVGSGMPMILSNTGQPMLGMEGKNTVDMGEGVTGMAGSPKKGKSATTPLEKFVAPVVKKPPTSMEQAEANFNKPMGISDADAMAMTTRMADNPKGTSTSLGMGTNAMPSEAMRGVQPVNPNYGLRPDGSKKGQGYLGVNKMTDGSNRDMTENSIGSPIMGKEMDYPTMVPTLSPEEKSWMLAGGDVRSKDPMAQSIQKKSRDHALMRKSHGLNVFND